MKHVIALENANDSWKKVNEDDIRKQKEAGIQVITFDPATAKQYYAKAYEVAWESAIKASPQYGPQMRKLFSKWLYALLRSLAAAAAVLLGAMALLVTLDVVMRNVGLGTIVGQRGLGVQPAGRHAADRAVACIVTSTSAWMSCSYPCRAGSPGPRKTVTCSAWRSARCSSGTASG